MNKLQVKKISTLLAILVVALALLMSAFTLPNIKFSSADATDFTEFPATDLGISNPQFSEKSGNAPATPSSWTGGSLASGSGQVISGVIDLESSAYEADGNSEEFKLNEYPEYKSAKPTTIFGTSAYAGTNTNVLMINVPKNSETAYGYTSSSMTFDANSFYRVSAWVKTGDFRTGTGASIRLTGLNKDIAFTAINTVAKLDRDSNGLPILNSTNNYGWVEYVFYVRTSPLSSSTISLRLSVGDELIEDGNVNATNYASGYAFFDNVSAERISASAFSHGTTSINIQGDDYSDTVTLSNGRTIVMGVNLNETKYLAPDHTNEVGSFSDTTTTSTAQIAHGWTRALYSRDEDADYNYGQASAFIYNTQTEYSEVNNYGLTAKPWSPYGDAETFGNPMFASQSNVLLLTTYTGRDGNGTYNKGAIGYASEDITIEQFKYYRIGVWVKADNVSEGSGINVALVGESTITADDCKLYSFNSGLTGNDEDTAHYGWQEYSYYIPGSIYKDLKLHVELWLGTPDSLSSGTALFDNVTVQELSYSDYTSYSGGTNATTISLDAENTSTGIANGNFNIIADNEETPYTPSSWTALTPDLVSSSGFSANPVPSAERAVRGIVPTSENAFNAMSGDLLGAPNPYTYAGASNVSSVLLMASREKTAIGYRSESLTFAVNTEYAFSVTLATANIEGYGVNIVLRDSEQNVLATIEKIETNGKFTTYTIYLNAATNTEATGYLEIWLGLNDRVDNTQKLSSGYVYISNATATSRAASNTADEESNFVYSQVLEQYKAALKASGEHASDLPLNYACYSYSGTYVYYDRYSTDKVKPTYNYKLDFTVSDAAAPPTYGAFSSNNVPSYLPSHYRNDNLENDTVVFLRNTADGYSRVNLTNGVVLGADAYFRIDVKIKVDISDENIADKNKVGANIILSSDIDVAFRNIKDTSLKIGAGNAVTYNKEHYKTYSTYVSTSTDGAGISLVVSLGGTENSKQLISGILYIGEINVTEITNVEYEDFVEAYDANDALETDDEDYDASYESTAYAAVEAETEEPEETEEESDFTLPWYVLPSIIFSAALIAVLIIVIVVKLKERHVKRKKVTYKNEYDINKTLEHLDKLDKADSSKDTTAVTDTYASFDDDKTPETNTEVEGTTETAESTEGTAEEAKPDEKPDEKPDVDKFND